MIKGLNRIDYIRLKKNIIKKLYAKRAFSKGHLLFERLQAGIPSHLKGFVKEILNELINEKLVLFYGNTKHGPAYQLNVKKIREIEDLIFS